MGAHRTTLWLERIVLAILLFVSSTTAIAAQPPDAALRPGSTVWITDSTGRQDQARILDLSDGVVTATIGDAVRRVRTTDVLRVEARRSDSLWNGALIGAAAGVASGLLLCRMSEPWRNCRDDVGPMLRIGALGAGIGMGIDALIRKRETVYSGDAASTHVYVAPIVAPRARGLQVSLRF